jgi:hypothetical protein
MMFSISTCMSLFFVASSCSMLTGDGGHDGGGGDTGVAP